MCDHCGCSDANHDNQEEHHHEHAHKSIEIEAEVLAHNRSHADHLRKLMAEKSSRIVNIIGSPGSGKTELLSKLIPMLKVPCVVVEGDLATRNDAVRIEATGAPVHQIETGTACHLNAHDIEHALEHLPLEEPSLVIVENVGNLVCPSMFDIGESLRIVCLSITEGADKPEKYPVSFREADVVILTKTDLLPYVEFDVDHCKRLLNDVHPDVPVYITDAKTPSGLEPVARHLLALFDASC